MDETDPPRTAEEILPELRTVRKTLSQLRVDIAIKQAEVAGLSRERAELADRESWLESELADSLLLERGAM